MDGANIMRLILQGRKSRLPVLKDVWVMFDQSGTFRTPKYLTLGYNRLDAYLVGGGCGGGAGGRSYQNGGAIYGGGGGGGGGSGQLVRLMDVNLFTLPTIIPYTIGRGAPGGEASLPDGDGRRDGGGENWIFEDQSTLFNDAKAYGGFPGLQGMDAQSNRSAGGGGGGAGGAMNSAGGHYWSYLSPTVPSEGYTGLYGGGSGGNGAVNGTAPTEGTTGSVYSPDPNALGGAGGGGGGIAASSLVSDEIARVASKGGTGGPGLGSVAAPGLDGGFFKVDTRFYRSAGGGAGGSAPNLTKISRLGGMTGYPDQGYTTDGSPGAGGYGGIGGLSKTTDIPGQDGRPGNDGCILLRVFVGD